MVVKMMKWSPWPPVSASKKFQVKVKPIKLQGLLINGYFETIFKEEEDEHEKEENKVVKVEMIWKGSKLGLAAGLRRASNHNRNVSSEIILQRNVDIEWNDDEFESVCNFSMFQKDNSFNPWDVSFNLLYGQKEEKLVVIGTVSFNIAELASQMEAGAQIERKLPIVVQVAGFASEATLLISVNFVEIRTESVEIGTEAVSEDGFLRRVLSKSKSKKKKKIGETEPVEAVEVRALKTELTESDESTIFDSDSSPDNSLVPIQTSSVDCVNEDGDNINDSDKDTSSVSQLGLSPSPEQNRLDSVAKVGFWKKRKLSFRSFKKKEEPLLIKKAEVDQPLIGSNSVDSTSSKEKTNENATSNSSTKPDIRKQELSIGVWEEKELISRDGQTKLKANIFAASIDQCSEKAAGESACTALVALIANWLQTNPEKMPTLSEFDNLITEGSSEWRKLCDNEVYINRFPDKHFDLETVLEAKLRPLSVIPDKSFIGFFCPESFESLKGAMSFDAIWEEISKHGNESNDDHHQVTEAQVYIVSWNDHFFVLKVETDAYYVIDTLGERLFEGCNKAYILKFDKNATVYDLSKKKVEENAVSDKEIMSSSSSSEELGAGMKVWNGKECCREFIKRFLAAIPLRELEVEEKKGTLSTIPLHQRLQIEFHFSSSSSSSSSSS